MGETLSCGWLLQSRWCNYFCRWAGDSLRVWVNQVMAFQGGGYENRLNCCIFITMNEKGVLFTWMEIQDNTQSTNRHHLLLSSHCSHRNHPTETPTILLWTNIGDTIQRVLHSPWHFVICPEIKLHQQRGTDLVSSKCLVDETLHQLFLLQTIPIILNQTTSNTPLTL